MKKNKYSESLRMEKQLELEGKEFYDNYGEKFIVIKYINANNVIIRYEIDGTEKTVTSQNIENLQVSRLSPIERKKQELEGKEFYNNKGEKFIIIEYKGSKDILIEFEDGLIRKTVTMDNIESGYIARLSLLEEKRLELIGRSFFNIKKEKFTIVDYNGCDDVEVEFEIDGQRRKTTMTKIRRGQVFRKSSRNKNKCKSKKEKSSKDVFYHFNNFFNDLISKNIVKNVNKKHKLHHTWKHIVIRTLSEEYKEIQKTYKDCTICDEWLDFNNFIEWYEKNYYEIDGEKLAVDKDILSDNNKIYSPATCLLIPAYLNSKFVNLKKVNKIYQNKNGDYKIKFYNSITDKNTSITSKDKESLTKDILDIKMTMFKHSVETKYKGKIPQNTYDILMGLE